MTDPTFLPSPPLPLAPVPIGDLLGMSFWVEAYQRGYKWKREEVEALLSDIEAFSLDRDGPYYCLQPLVVVPSQREAGAWELIDGQQRLTTIYIILCFLEVSVERSFHLHYRTRKESENFLPAMHTFIQNVPATWTEFIREDPTADNIDNYHFFTAWQTIAGWFKDEKPDRKAFQEKLLRQTVVIWYKADPHDPRATFMRLNSGKIPLNNAEKIKALFLRGDERDPHTASRQREMAQEWDQIEYALAKPNFWAFIHESPKTDQRPARIEFILDLVAEKHAKTNQADFTFHVFAKLLPPGHDVDAQWRRVKKCFLTLEEWFEDRQLYHLVGFVVDRGLARLGTLLEESRESTKTEFLAAIHALIRQRFQHYKLSKLRFGEKNEELKDVLLLFNLLPAISDEAESRFPFHLYKGGRSPWSLEHIHAQNARGLTAQEWVEWTETQRLLLKNVLAGESLLEKLAQWEAQTLPFQAKEAARQILALEIIAYFGEAEPGEEMHELENLALLDGGSNTALGNEPFPVKRQRILDKIAEGKFIPIETRNVFLKYYSTNLAEMTRWTKPDRDLYLEKIRQRLKPYLTVSDPLCE